MKYLLILLIPVAAFAGEPKFYLGQKVHFKVPFFYSHVCKNVAMVIEVTESYSRGLEYTLATTAQGNFPYGCPDLIINEKDIIQ